MSVKSEHRRSTDTMPDGMTDFGARLGKTMQGFSGQGSGDNKVETM